MNSPNRDWNLITFAVMICSISVRGLIQGGKEAFDHLGVPGHPSSLRRNANLRKEFGDLTKAHVLLSHVDDCFNHPFFGEMGNQLTLSLFFSELRLGGISVWEMGFTNGNSKTNKVLPDSLFGGKNL